MGIILRWLHLFYVADSPVLNRLIIDSAFYQRWAEEIAGGDIIGEGVFFMSPLYPYLLGGLYFLFGSSPLPVVFLQTIFSGMTIWMLWNLGRRLGGEIPAIIAAWGGALFPVWIYFDGAILTASLILFLNTAGLLLIFRWLETGKLSTLFFSGLSFGLSALARPSALLISLFLAIWLLSRRRKKAALFFIVGTIVIISPVTIRNWLASGEFCLITASGGMNFFTGNNPQATGLYSEAEFLRSSEPEFEAEDYRREAQIRDGRPMNLTQSSRFWYGEGLSFIFANPLSAVRLYWNKFFYFWNNLEAPNNISYYLTRRYSPPLCFLRWGFGILAALGMTGLIFTQKSREKEALLIYLSAILAANLLFFTSSEFRFPAVNVLLLGVGMLYFSLRGWIKEKKISWKAVVFLLFALFLAHYQTQLATKLKSPRMDFFNLGSVCLKDRDYSAAIEYFSLSLKEDANFHDALMGRGTALLEVGRYEAAATDFQSAGFDVTPDILKEKMEGVRD